MTKYMTSLALTTFRNKGTDLVKDKWHNFQHINMHLANLFFLSVAAHILSVTPIGLYILSFGVAQQPVID